jgi:hypothetical protein
MTARADRAERIITDHDYICAMAAGLLPSPQSMPKSTSVNLFKLRITGTRIAWREKLQQWACRPEDVWLSPDMQSRWMGAPITVNHPPGGLIRGSDPPLIVGAIVHVFVDDDNLMCIARIWNAEVAELMEKYGTDTSPGVEVGQTERIEIDGDVIEKEIGPPRICDHLALVPLGVWSREAEPTGMVDNVEQTT